MLHIFLNTEVSTSENIVIWNLIWFIDLNEYIKNTNMHVIRDVTNIKYSLTNVKNQIGGMKRNKRSIINNLKANLKSP